MNAINFIAKHLDPVWVTDPVHNVDTVCAFTGQPIKQGIRKKDAISNVFTDHAYLKYPSDYISIDAYLCIKEVIETEKGANALRNYSFFVSEDGLELLPRDKILTRMLMNRTDKRKQFGDNSFPFVFCVTQGGKKHLTYKATVNYNNERYIITTDFWDVEFGINAQMLKLVGACQRFYAIIPDSKEDATWFTKDEILTGNYQSKRIETYGIDDWTRLENVIKPYHNTPLLRLLTFALNKLNENEFIC